MSRFRSAFSICFLLFATAAAFAANQSLTGEVGDAMCGAKHMMPGESPASCTRECVKGGSKYVLIVGDKVYTLEGHGADLDKLAGQKAKVTGDLKGETMTVANVAAAK